MSFYKYNPFQISQFGALFYGLPCNMVRVRVEKNG